MSARKRILLGCNVQRATASGAATTLLWEGSLLEKHGWDVSYAFAPQRNGVAARIDRQLAYGRIVRAVRQTRPDVAVISSGDGALLPRLAPDSPLVVQSHGLEHLHRSACLTHGVESKHFGVGHRFIREPAVAYAMRHAAAVAVKNEAESDAVISRLGVHSSRVHTIANGVEDMFLDADREPQVEPTIVWIGSWLERKGIRFLPGTIERVQRRYPEVILHIVGCRAPERDVRAFFPSTLQGNLRVAPAASRAEVVKACAGAWVGLGTSYFEGFGKNVIEMVAAGLPVVATRVGVSPDVVTDNATGYLVRHDEDELSSAILRLFRSPELRNRLGAEARKVAETYRWTYIGNEWNILLESVVDDKARYLRAFGRSVVPES